MEATSEGWSRRKNVIGYVLKFGLLIQRTRGSRTSSDSCWGVGLISVLHDLMSVHDCRANEATARRVRNHGFASHARDTGLE